MWGFRKKKLDPLAVRERELEAELTRLQGEIGRLAREEPTPIPTTPEKPATGGIPAKPFAQPPRPATAPTAPPPGGHINEFGARKYDLQAAWQRFVSHFRGPTSNNPRMVRMLAAGSIHGLRPLRYERRVARRRFIALFVILLLILWGLGYSYLRNR
jgi:hypothetical protein